MRAKFMIGFADAAKINIDEAGQVWQDWSRCHWKHLDIISAIENGGWERGEIEGYSYYLSRHVS
jgi:hypothetical protein